MSHSRKPFDPVILVALGIGLITFAVILLALQNQTSEALNIGVGSGFWGRIFVAFITGLTTGGLSCLAVQGGLLASSLAKQIEDDYLEQAQTYKNKKRHLQIQKRTNTALSILLFLIAKIIIYTLLGILLGWVGKFLTLSPFTRAVLMIVIGIFMLGNALRSSTCIPSSVTSPSSRRNLSHATFVGPPKVPTLSLRSSSARSPFSFHAVSLKQ